MIGKFFVFLGHVMVLQYPLARGYQEIMGKDETRRIPLAYSEVAEPLSDFLSYGCAPLQVVCGVWMLLRIPGFRAAANCSIFLVVVVGALLFTDFSGDRSFQQLYPSFSGIGVVNSLETQSKNIIISGAYIGGCLLATGYYGAGRRLLALYALLNACWRWNWIENRVAHAQMMNAGSGGPKASAFMVLSTVELLGGVLLCTSSRTLQRGGAIPLIMTTMLTFVQHFKDLQPEVQYPYWFQVHSVAAKAAIIGSAFIVLGYVKDAASKKKEA